MDSWTVEPFRELAVVKYVFCSVLIHVFLMLDLTLCKKKEAILNGCIKVFSGLLRTESVCASCLLSSVYSALIERARHASFRKVLVSPALSGVMSQGLPIWTCTNRHTHSYRLSYILPLSLQRCTGLFNVAWHFL